MDFMRMFPDDPRSIQARQKLAEWRTQEVAPRRQFIEDNALNAKLDI